MKRLALLDYGRFFAAVIVVLFHYTCNGILNEKIISVSSVPWVVDITKYGYLGVDFFFMISGYVIFFSARNRTASQFAVGRALRLYPAYWFAVIFTAVFTLLWGHSNLSVTVPQVLVNMTMLQSHLGVRHVDAVYWTLVYELFFYGAVFGLLLLGLQKKLDRIFMAWPYVLVMALLLGVDNFPFLGGFYCYFAAGALFAAMSEKPRWSVAMSLLIAYALCMQFAVGIAARFEIEKGFAHSPYVVATIVTACFAFFVVQNMRSVQRVNLPLSETLGILTYPVYLIHCHAGYIIINHFATEDNKVWVYGLTFAFIVLVSWLMHKVIEQRMAGFWRRLFNATVGRLADGMQVGLQAGLQVVFRALGLRHKNLNDAHIQASRYR